MLSLEWYRNFLAVYRAGSVSGAARAQSLTQPAISQQLAALESAIGAPLFERTAKGMAPTPRGEALYTQVFESIDRLDRVSRSLLPSKDPNPVVRFGSTPEYLHEFALPRLAPLGISFAASLGNDRELLAQVETGALDTAVTTQRPTARTMQFRALGERRFILIAASDTPGMPEGLSPGELAEHLNAHAWVSYSEERPTTRRFWQQVLGARFAARTRLVVPDLRTVVRAVQLGLGLSIVPEFVCRRLLDEGSVKELTPIAELIPTERWLLVFREMDSEREQILRIAKALTE